MRALLVAVAAFATGCAAPCNTADLDAKYAISLIEQCDGSPLSECPAADALGDEYERAARERIEQCQD